ncbi:hypothetical protein PR202_gb04550 [Eleusine coracana subsp. coracana]|uniref:Protein kinase domain-containing protein n=1 Tax=Eleusine coracana subsp. coracana TaxID=191504 RepID=A0AAV5E4M5_ELECO|nr:hypothetical protein PR202_gb04550 [Eleusine coracana subsp. coracana]
MQTSRAIRDCLQQTRGNNYCIFGLAPSLPPPHPELALPWVKLASAVPELSLSRAEPTPAKRDVLVYRAHARMCCLALRLPIAPVCSGVTHTCRALASCMPAVLDPFLPPCTHAPRSPPATPRFSPTTPPCSPPCCCNSPPASPWFSPAPPNPVVLHAVGGYMAPEYINIGEVTTKVDIYSLGIIIVEMVGGRKIKSCDWVWLNEICIEVVRNLAYENLRNYLKVSPSDTTTEIEYQQKVCLEIGLNCIKHEPKERPSIREIIGSLDIIGYVSNEERLPEEQETSKWRAILPGNPLLPPEAPNLPSTHCLQRRDDPPGPKVCQASQPGILDWQETAEGEPQWLDPEKRGYKLRILLLLFPVAFLFLDSLRLSLSGSELRLVRPSSFVEKSSSYFTGQSSSQFFSIVVICLQSTPIFSRP